MIDLPAFRNALLEHFDRTRRSLPWRSERTPYRVMVSEFMLQQTRVETVIPYYERWLRRFPGWGALAEAGEDEVLRAWAGLGYYRRARNLHSAARVVWEQFGGELPEDHEALRRLPGVGEYTAGAVASIVFGRAVPAVDGNVRRVLCRLFDLEAPTAGRLREEAAALVDPGRPGDFNEALMELGATVCTPGTPGCGVCPVREWCGARVAGTVGQRPARRPRREVRRVGYVVVVVVERSAGVGEPRGPARSPRAAGNPPPAVTLVRKRPATGLLAGMWEFPSLELADDGKPGHLGLAAAATRLLGDLGVHARPATPLHPVRHAFTHLRATYHPVICLPARPHPLPPPYAPPTPAPPTTPRGSRPATPVPHPTPLTIPPPVGDTAPDHPPSPTWIPLADLDDLALPAAQRKIAARLRTWLRDNPRQACG